MAASKKRKPKPPHAPAAHQTKAPPEDRILARVRKLLALAADPGASEEERRTSAMVAAKLMREHGIAIGAPPPAAPSPVPMSHPAAAYVPIDAIAIVQNVQGLVSAFTAPGGLLDAMRSFQKATRRR